MGSLFVFIIVGAVIGAGLGAVIWFAIQKSQAHVNTLLQKDTTNKSQPAATVPQTKSENLQATPQQPEKVQAETKSVSPEQGNRKHIPTAEEIANEVAKRFPKPAPPSAKPEHHEPTFKEIPGPFQVIMGSNHMILSESNTRDKPVHMLQLGDYASIDGYVENGRVYVNAVLFGDENQKVVTIKHNEFTSPPAKWDRNFDDTALEIVDGNLVPRFQLIYKDTRTVIINGVYPHPGGLIVMADDGMTINPTPPLRVTMRRRFKYPSRLYQGQEITPQ